jgi:hypothetical protein
MGDLSKSREDMLNRIFFFLYRLHSSYYFYFFSTMSLHLLLYFLVSIHGLLRKQIWVFQTGLWRDFLSKDKINIEKITFYIFKILNV